MLSSASSSFPMDFRPSHSKLSSRPESDKFGRYRAVVKNEGFISLELKSSMTVDIALNQAIRISNPMHNSVLCLSGCGTQLAIIHPNGRLIQYSSRIELQAVDVISTKHAKIWSKGISFASSKGPLIYLLDEAGCRSIMDEFHDLSCGNIANNMFMINVGATSANSYEAFIKAKACLEEVKYWRTDTNMNCWTINNIYITQTNDGLVSVHRNQGSELSSMIVSPNNGKIKVETNLLYATSSLGPDGHFFVKSNSKRIHYNGSSFIVRHGGQSAGYDENGVLRLW